MHGAIGQTASARRRPPCVKCSCSRMPGMTLIVDFLYLVAALISAPVWLTRRILAGKAKTDWAGRLGRTPALPPSDRPRLLFHAVSVGEVNAIRGLVERLAADFDVVIAATTDTGIERARALFGPRHAVVRYPLDFSHSVRRFLDAVRPDAVALVELEVWPNFTRECKRQGIALAIVNGRLSDRSYPRYRRFRPIIRPSFRRLDLVIAQDETIAKRFIDLGAEPHRVRVVGTMKWDNAAAGTKEVEAAAARLAEALGIDRGRPIIVAGSTGPGEEWLVRDAVPSGAQLIVAPRKPERFDDAARILDPCVRRSAEGGGGAGGADRFLLDTIGELRAAYVLADLVIVGRTFNNQRGSDMMEPIALGKAVIVGPDVSNFESVARALLEGGGLVQVEAAELAPTIERLLRDGGERAAIAGRGLAVIRARQGTVEAHAALLRQLLAR